MASKSSKRRRKRRQRARERAGAGDAGDSAAADGAAKSDDRATTRRAERRRSAALDQRPPAPWGKFPLIELTVLVGIVMLVAGLILGPGERGGTFLVTGLVLASIGGLELSIREHFAGYRSHTAILAAFPAAVVLGLLFYLGPDGLPIWLRLVIGATVFAVAAALLVRVFRARSGGLSFKLSGFRSR